MRLLPHRHPTSPGVPELLAGAGPFAGVDVAALAPVAANADRLHLDRGTVLAQAEQPAREFVLLLSGRLTAVAPDGRRRPLLPGASVGGSELADGTSHAETVVAEGDAGADVLVVHGQAFRWAVAELLAPRGG